MRRVRFIPAALAFLVIVTAALAATPKLQPPADVRAADQLAAQPPSAERDRALEAWAKRASVAEIVWVLRRPPETLGAAEASLAAAALERVPAGREALRRRLLVRQALAASAKTAPGWRDLLSTLARFPAHPRASAFRIAAVLPDTGDYQSYGALVRRGIEAGVRSISPPAGLAIEVVSHATGAGTAAGAAAAFASASDRSGVVIGELLSLPTFVLAAAGEATGVPVVSPSASDEAIGTIGRSVFQIGPSSWGRGAALARQARGGKPARIGVLTSSEGGDDAFADGFASVAASLGSAVVWRDHYARGTVNFTDAVRVLAARRVDLLFWDGEPRELDALLRQLSRERLSLRICGGEPLTPERHHPETRVLLEGVEWVGAEWRLVPGAHATLDSLVAAAGHGEEAGLVIRGWLAGRVVAKAIAGGALCPEEIAAALAARRSSDATLGARGFLDVGAEGATLPLYKVVRGRAVLAQ